MVSGLLYGVTIACVDVASNHIPPVTLTALRLLTASVAWAMILYFLRPDYHLEPVRIADIFIMAMLNLGLPFFLLATSLKYISGSLAALIFNTGPVFTVVAAHYLLSDERLSKMKIIATAIVTVGATMLIASNSSGLEGGDRGWIGQLLILGASFAGAMGVIYIRVRFRGENYFALSAGQVFASMSIFVPAALISNGGMPDLASYPWQSWVAVAVSALASPVIGFWLMFYMVDKYSASLGGFSGIATPLFSTIIGILLLGDVITLPIAASAILLLLGVWTLQYF